MNDYWNDPPETDELPECCDEYMNFNENTGICKCLKCGKVIEPPRDIEPIDLELPNNDKEIEKE
jgi:hypothetical protein